ncbi:MAG: helicase-related protein, partial [Planctomycetota bacterium]
MANDHKLPIDDHLDSLLEVLDRQGGRLLLAAAPGAGKSTRLPPALLAHVTGQVLCLQPRRVAARALAQRVAAERGSRLGDEIGFRTRFEHAGGTDTRLWYGTEGILLRRLRRDPYLEEIAAVVLDEFHERSVAADLLLGWLSELQQSLRPDLRLVVMSATLDGMDLAGYLGVQRYDIPGQSHAVSTHYEPARSRERLHEHVRRVVASHCRDPEQTGDVLVFLPGRGEIRACAEALVDLTGYQVQQLHGGLPPAEQDAVLRVSERPRLVLATNLAETSLTVPGVRTVIDAGLQRVDRFDLERGFDCLRLEPCSRAAADQRRGRAGREAPGRCIRLWSRLQEQRRPVALEPAVGRGDPLPVLCELKSWWGRDSGSFPWLTSPPAAHMAAAEAELRSMGLLEADGRLNPEGRLIAALPLHPRLARLLVLGARHGQLP